MRLNGLHEDSGMLHACGEKNSALSSHKEVFECMGVRYLYLRSSMLLNQKFISLRWRSNHRLVVII